MTPRGLLITLLSVGCAAAVPATHGLFGGDPATSHPGHSGWHGGHGKPGPHEAVMHGSEAIRARVDAALDPLGLDLEARAKVDAILEPRLGDVVALVDKIESGEIDHETAFAEHEKIVTAAKAELAAVLTPDQIEQFLGGLHPQGECMLRQ